MATAIIETRGLSKHYGKRKAVDGVDLDVRHGEVFGYLGPNGAGKTTSMRMLVGLISPTAGTALVAGFPPGDPRGLAKIGCLIETPAFYPFLSGRDNLRMLARYSGIPDRRVEEVLVTVDLAVRAKDAFKRYSLGMKQRLGVAAALLKDPDLLILDEPANGLDPEGMVEMRHLVRELGQGERTVLISSHLLDELEHICDRVAILVEGRLVKQGTVAELRGGQRLQVRATPTEKARATLAEMVGQAAVTESEGAFQVAVDVARAGEVNRRLVEAGIEVTELRQLERSLEDAFLQITHADVAAS